MFDPGTNLVAWAYQWETLGKSYSLGVDMWSFEHLFPLESNSADATLIGVAVRRNYKTKSKLTAEGLSDKVDIVVFYINDLSSATECIKLIQYRFPAGLGKLTIRAASMMTSAA